MTPGFLLPETTVTKDGSGPAMPIAEGTRLLQVTLGVTSIIEQESLDVQIFASSDADQWPAKPTAAFPQKFYKGLWTIIVELPEGTRFIQARWKVNRWGRGDQTPMFRFYVAAEQTRLANVQS